MVQTSRRPRLAAAAIATVVLVLMSGGVANAATSIDGPIDLGTSELFAVLAASTVTNTGTSVLNGDVGLSPGTSTTGFESVVIDGTIHQTDEVAAQAQVDLTTAYNVAASLTPAQTGLGDLTGLSLVPGVYAGGELSVTGELTLNGAAESVWIFQAASTLNIGSGGIVTVTGGASVCNVFWQVSSSATLEPGARLVGTVMADESITAKTAATVEGRLLARTAAVTLDTNTITAPTGCDESPGTVTSSPDITSDAPPEGRSGDTYSHTITATGTPTPSFAVTAGELPPGIELNAVTGTLTGVPTTPGSFEFEVTVSNGIAPNVVGSYVLVITPPRVIDVPAGDSDASGVNGAAPRALAASGADVGLAPLLAAAFILGGLLLVMRSRTRTRRPQARSTAAPSGSE